MTIPKVTEEEKAALREDFASALGDETFGEHISEEVLRVVVT